MRQVMKTVLLAGVVMFGLLQSGLAFSLGGPIGFGGDAWQTAAIGYGLGGDLNAPKNLGEGYRRNTPVMYYAFDANFVDYFSTNGQTAVEDAFGILNSTFTNNPTGMTDGLDGYSSSLSEFPLSTININYQAQALGMFDLKSITLGMLMEQMGLADPVRYDWTLHNRYEEPNTTCPVGMEYLVVQRNFDLGGYPIPGSQNVLSPYSPYVNGVLYSYQILETCGPDNPLAVSVPIAVDPTQNPYSPVASSYGGEIFLPTLFGLETAVFPSINQYGAYYTGLTRDDVMGLKYLLQTNTINWESPAPGSFATIAVTNFTSTNAFPANANSPNGYGTLDLGTLLSSARTNDPVTLEGLFPGVIVSSTVTNLAYTTITNVVVYFTNYLSSPYGSPPQLVIATNLTPSFITVYADTFANIVTNHYSPNSVVTVQTVTVGPILGAPYPAPIVTNTTSTLVTLPGVPSGDYYIIPTNGCGEDILSTYFTNVVTITNTSSLFATNIPAATNTTGTAFSYAQVVIQQTNYVFAVHPVACTQTANEAGLYEGVEKINFVYSSYDSLIGQSFQPITNNYTMLLVTNSQIRTLSFQRVVTTPDFLFSAADLISNSPPAVYESLRNVTFDTANALPGLGGPGTITPPTQITFNKSGPVYYNLFGTVMNGYAILNQAPGYETNAVFDAYYVWGSFDGTTNLPVVYPNTSSIDDIQNQILIQITPSSLPNGTNGVLYPAQTFAASGGSFTKPYTWSATGLPTGLNISSASSEGILYGTPTQTGTNFNVTLTLTDYLSRTVQWNYSLTILSSSQ
jgi:hypothetical protein